MVEAQLAAFTRKQRLAEAVIRALGEEWTGGSPPDHNTLFVLTKAYFQSQGEEAWWRSSFSENYWSFLIDAYLSERGEGTL